MVTCEICFHPMETQTFKLLKQMNIYFEYDFNIFMICTNIFCIYFELLMVWWSGPAEYILVTDEDILISF